MTPNPSLKLTRYGKHCEAWLRHTVHLLSLALQRSPPWGERRRAAKARKTT